MRRNGHKTTSGVKSDSIFELYVPDFLYDKKFWKLDHDFRYFLANFLLCIGRNSHKSTSGQIFNPKFDIVMGCFLFWRCFRQDLYVFCTRNCFRNAKFSEFGVYCGWGWKFFDKTPKRDILAWFHAFWAIDRANQFTGFSLGEPTIKKLQKNTTKSHRETICGNSPLNQIELKLAYQ